MEVSIRPYRLYIVAFLVGAIALASIWLLADPESGSLEYELCRLLMQFLVLIVVGGALKFGIDEHHAGRDARTDRREAFRELIRHLAENYSRAKRIRRELRIEFAGDGSMPYEVYRSKISELIDTQLELEILLQDLSVTTTDWPRIEICVKQMEEFLKEVIDDFRKRLVDDAGETELVIARDLKGAEHAFISEEDGNEWYQRYVLGLYEARRLAREASTNPVPRNSN